MRNVKLYDLLENIKIFLGSIFGLGVDFDIDFDFGSEDVPSMNITFFGKKSSLAYRDAVERAAAFKAVMDVLLAHNGLPISKYRINFDYDDGEKSKIR